MCRDCRVVGAERETVCCAHFKSYCVISELVKRQWHAEKRLRLLVARRLYGPEAHNRKVPVPLLCASAVRRQLISFRRTVYIIVERWCTGSSVERVCLIYSRTEIRNRRFTLEELHRECAWSTLEAQSTARCTDPL